MMLQNCAAHEKLASTKDISSIEKSPLSLPVASSTASAALSHGQGTVVTLGSACVFLHGV